MFDLLQAGMSRTAQAERQSELDLLKRCKGKEDARKRGGRSPNFLSTKSLIHKRCETAVAERVRRFNGSTFLVRRVVPRPCAEPGGRSPESGPFASPTYFRSIEREKRRRRDPSL